MTDNEVPILFIKKMAGSVLLIVGFVIAFIGFGAGSPAFGIAGLLIAMSGLVLWALKIIRRNQRTDV